MLNVVYKHILEGTVPTKINEVRLYDVIKDELESVVPATKEIVKELNVDDLDFLSDTDIKKANTLLEKYEEEAKQVGDTPKQSEDTASVAEKTTRGFSSAEEAVNSPEMKERFAKINEMKKKGRVTKTSNNLYHTTSATNIESILKEGLVTKKSSRFEGVSDSNKISFSANEAGAKYYGGADDILLRTKTSYKPDDLELDLLAGGEGTYTTGKSVPPEMLQIKIGNKWIDLNKLKQSQIRKLLRN